MSLKLSAQQILAEVKRSQKVITLNRFYDVFKA